MSSSNPRHVTIRVKLELYRLYQIYLVKENRTMKDDITEHIKKQARNYEMPKYNMSEYSNMEYTKVNFLIDIPLYSKYKIALITNQTTPTADITRYMMSVVQ